MICSFIKNRSQNCVVNLDSILEMKGYLTGRTESRLFVLTYELISVLYIEKLTFINRHYSVVTLSVCTLSLAAAQEGGDDYRI